VQYRLPLPNVRNGSAALKFLSVKISPMPYFNTSFASVSESYIHEIDISNVQAGAFHMWFNVFNIHDFPQLSSRHQSSRDQQVKDRTDNRHDKVKEKIQKRCKKRSENEKIIPDFKSISNPFNIRGAPWNKFILVNGCERTSFHIANFAKLRSGQR
jgi:hypothetical protein